MSWLSDPLKSLSGVLGGGSNPYKGDLQDDADYYKKIRDQYNPIASTFQNFLMPDVTQARNDRLSLRDAYLRGTGQSGINSYVAPDVANINSTFDRAGFNLDADNARRGLTNAGSDVGTRTGLAGQRAMAISTARNNGQNWATQRDLQNRASAYNLSQGAADQDYSHLTNAWGQQGALTGNVAELQKYLAGLSAQEQQAFYQNLMQGLQMAGVSAGAGA